MPTSPTPQAPIGNSTQGAEPSCSICGGSPARIRTYLPFRPTKRDLCADCADAIGDAVHKIVMARCPSLRREAS